MHIIPKIPHEPNQPHSIPFPPFSPGLLEAAQQAGNVNVNATQPNRKTEVGDFFTRWERGHPIGSPGSSSDRRDKVPAKGLGGKNVLEVRVGLLLFGGGGVCIGTCMRLGYVSYFTLLSLLRFFLCFLLALLGLLVSWNCIGIGKPELESGKLEWKCVRCGTWVHLHGYIASTVIRT